MKMERTLGALQAELLVAGEAILTPPLSLRAWRSSVRFARCWAISVSC